MTQIWNNEIISKKSFPKNLKLADLTPVIKKIDSTLAGNYRSVTVLPNVSKVFEKLMQKQSNNYINIFISPFFMWLQKKGTVLNLHSRL